jgi:hypothetical protein
MLLCEFVRRTNLHHETYNYCYSKYGSTATYLFLISSENKPCVVLLFVGKWSKSVQIVISFKFSSILHLLEYCQPSCQHCFEQFWRTYWEEFKAFFTLISVSLQSLERKSTKHVKLTFAKDTHEA